MVGSFNLRDMLLVAQLGRYGMSFNDELALTRGPQPLRSALAGCSPGDVSRCVGPAAAEMVALLPELAPLLPVAASAVVLDPEQVRRRQQAQWPTTARPPEQPRQPEPARVGWPPQPRRQAPAATACRRR